MTENSRQSREGRQWSIKLIWINVVHKDRDASSQIQLHVTGAKSMRPDVKTAVTFPSAKRPSKFAKLHHCVFPPVAFNAFDPNWPERLTFMQGQSIRTRSPPSPPRIPFKAQIKVALTSSRWVKSLRVGTKASRSRTTAHMGPCERRCGICSREISQPYYMVVGGCLGGRAGGAGGVCTASV